MEAVETDFLSTLVACAVESDEVVVHISPVLDVVVQTVVAKEQASIDERIDILERAVGILGSDKLNVRSRCSAPRFKKLKTRIDVSAVFVSSVAPAARSLLLAVVPRAEDVSVVPH